MKVGIDLAQFMIDEAVASRKVPICFQTTTTLACGAALVALTAKNLRHSLKRLCNLIRAIILEMRAETEFTFEAVATHLQLVTWIRDNIGAMVGARCSEECFQLPEGLAAREFLLWASRHVQATAVEPLVRLLSHATWARSWDTEDSANRRDIQAALTQDIPSALERLLDRRPLPEAPGQLNALIKEAEDDWEQCVTHLWLNDLCRPAEND